MYIVPSHQKLGITLEHKGFQILQYQHHLSMNYISLQPILPLWFFFAFNIKVDKHFFTLTLRDGQSI